MVIRLCLLAAKIALAFGRFRQVKKKQTFQKAKQLQSVSLSTFRLLVVKT